MGRAPAQARILKFGTYEVDRDSCELYKSGVRQKLTGQPFEVLCLLLENPQQIVTREQFQQRIWSKNTFVDYDLALRKAITRLRELLGDSAESPRFIETIPRKGYRFIADVAPNGNGHFAGDKIASMASAPTSIIDSLEGPVALEVGHDGVDSRVWGLSHRYLRTVVLAASSLLVLFSGVFWSYKHGSDSIPELRLKQLTLNSNQNPVHSGVISPDGRYLAYTDVDGIHLQLIESGESRTIATSLDGKQSRLWKVVGWLAGSTSFVANLYLPDQHQQSIWVYSMLGGLPQKLRDSAEAWSTSRDGSVIAFGNKFLRSGPVELWIMDARGEHEEKVVGTDPNGALRDARFSPDGQWLAYIRDVDIDGRADQPEQILETHSVRALASNKIVSAAQICGHFWLPDGRLIYGLRETADHSNSNYWTLHMDPRSGRSDASPRRLTNWAGFDLGQISATSDGNRMAFLSSVGVGEEYLADYSRTKHISTPRRLALDGENWPFAWTADSKQIILGTFRNGHSAIFKQSLESGSIEPIVTDAALPRLSPDGAWILYFAIPDIGSLMRVSASGGPSHFVLQSHSYLLPRCSLQPASLCLLSERTTDRKQLIWKSFDPVKGLLNELTRIDIEADADYDWALSPSAQTIAVRKNREAGIDFLDLTNHRWRHVAVEGWKLMRNLDWAPDGRGLFTCGIRAQGATLLYVDLKGKAQSIWEYRADYLWGLLSPDGQHLAMGAHSEKNNVWMMERF